MSNNFKDLYKSLPERKFEFELDVVGETTKIQYKGKFTSEIATLKVDSDIDRLINFLNGDNSPENLPLDTVLKHVKLAHLKHKLVEFPDWWKESVFGQELLDLNVITTLYDKIVEFENSWYEKIHGSSK